MIIDNSITPSFLRLLFTQPLSRSSKQILTTPKIQTATALCVPHSNITSVPIYCLPFYPHNSTSLVQLHLSSIYTPKSMKSINRRILSIIPRPVLQEPSNTLGPRAYPIQLDSASTAMAALVLLLVLCFLCFFSTCARRLFSLVHRRDTHLPPSSPLHRTRHFMFPPPCGLDPATLESLPVVKGRKEFGCCVVCLSDFEEKDHVKVIPKCGHRFHPSCIDVWLLTSGSCPVCRCSDMVTASRSYSALDSVLVHDGGGRSNESSVEEIEGRCTKEMVRLERSNSWGLGRVMGSDGSASRVRRSCSF